LHSTDDRQRELAHTVANRALAELDTASTCDTYVARTLTIDTDEGVRPCGLAV